MKVSGEITICDPGKDRPLEMIPTAQCCHCGGMWEIRPGSGRIRGWCTKCQGPVCGPGCAECVPHERQLDNMEAGLPANTPGPVMVQSAGGVWMPGDK